ncbi:DUF6794 domain-containing protein [Chitinophaga rhizophila]|uniref:DUF6794 domain-containing protein n=1 Tax=Chitinophaga rhizophila TaxID=2866212 RepID=A0ABS7GDH1_9BACT|nr:DUF6794 domain-containing protein [Chitinophaga rhizophila]MBW8684707.1 hypothetical protein [Chitinophaga rhizophila]
MKYFLVINVFLLLAAMRGYAQHSNVPSNMKQAIRFLDRDCPDSLKSIIKETANPRLKELSYPWGGNYKTIYNWTSNDNENSKIIKYLSRKGVNANQETIILIAFKEHLLGEKLNENAIYTPWKILEAKNKAEDKVRYTTDSLRGIYIPVNLEDCIRQIDLFWSDSIRSNVKQLTEDQFSVRAHHGFGMWIRNNWQLWAGSRLSKYFNDKGIYHPDDMSGIILDSYHRRLNNRDIKLEDQIQHYLDYWSKSKMEAIARKNEEFDAYKVGDTLTYKYRYGYVSKMQENKESDDICIAKCLLLEKDSDKHLLKIRLLISCSKKGIIIYDNKDEQLYDPVTKVWSRPSKRIRKCAKPGKSYWSDYNDWSIDAIN